MTTSAIACPGEGVVSREISEEFGGCLIAEASQAGAIVIGDKGVEIGIAFGMALREQAVIPHLAQNQSGRRSAIDGRTTRQPGYAVSQRIRKRIEEVFGWAKSVVGLRKLRHRGLPKVDWQFTLAMAAYDLARLPKLLAEAAP
jgi:hypothetical protein